MKYYALDLFVQPQPGETPADTARNMWNAAGRPQVTVKLLSNATEGHKVFRFTSLSLDELRVVADWFAGSPTAGAELMREVWEHGAN